MSSWLNFWTVKWNGALSGKTASSGGNGLFSPNSFPCRGGVLMAVIILYWCLLVHCFRVIWGPWVGLWFVYLLCQFWCPSIDSTPNESLSPCKHRMMRQETFIISSDSPASPLCTSHTPLGGLVSVWIGRPGWLGYFHGVCKAHCLV